MGSNKLFIGIDSGTQGTKAVVFNEKSGMVLAESYAQYDLIENHDGGREQNPEDWISACREVIHNVLKDDAVNVEDICGIGVSGQQHGMVPLDKEGNVIRAAKLWCDTETVAQCETLTERLGGPEMVNQKIGNQIAVGFTASKILWLKENEPENYAKLDSVLLPHDYINYWLTGEKVTDFGDASGTAYFDVRERKWSEDVLAAIDKTGKLKKCLPRLVQAHEPAGIVQPQILQEFGLSGEIIVSSGGGDNMMAAIGTGNVEEGVVTASFGTSGTIYAYADKPVIESSGELAAFCSSSGGWLPLICTMNVTVATELVRNLLAIDISEMNQLAESSPAGAEGIILLPYFNGERTPALPNGKAMFSGMSSLNFTRENICRAAMEGATFGMRYGLDVVKRNGIIPKEIRLVGGGAKSPLWRQIAADIFNCPVVCLVNEEAGAAGAALQVLWCWGHKNGNSKSLKDLVDKYIQLDEETRCFPNEVQAREYRDIYSQYLDLNKAAIELY